MINVYDGNSTIYLTLKEKCLLTSPNYLFRFVNRTTGQETTMVKKFTDDQSSFKDRYNQFVLKDGDLAKGQYAYYIYEQSSASNTDPSKARLIETGICTVHTEKKAYTVHNKTNRYVTR